MQNVFIIVEGGEKSRGNSNRFPLDIGNGAIWIVAWKNIIWRFRKLGRFARSTWGLLVLHLQNTILENYNLLA